MSVIHLLPDSVANQIAAGEVIQRPASVIKELMENSIDAGATEVRVLIQDAGRTQIQVIDNGCGMSETDARLAFERHATSKISSVHDLYALRTMGFRGEALASIAAVAQVELQTRTADSELGVKIVIAGSEIESQEPCATTKGCRFSVKNLFFNVPARRRFLKSDATEIRHIVAEFLRVALAHPNIGVSLSSNGEILYNLPAGNVKQRVVGVAGSGMAKHLLPIESGTSIVKITGFIGTPETAKKSNGDQYFFANDRYMRSAYFNKAVTDAYKGIILPDHTPAYFIYMTVEPDAIDVNVHPQKTEIKFDDEQAIWRILNATISSCLNDNNILPQIDFDSGARVEIPSFNPEAAKADTYNPFARESQNAAHYLGSMESMGLPEESAETSSPRTFVSGANAGYPASGSSYGSTYGGSYGGSTPGSAGGSGTSASGWQELYSGINSQGFITSGANSSANSDSMAATAASGAGLFDISQLPPTADPTKIVQYKQRYLMLPVASGLLIIDQRRAHERVLFDRLRAMVSQSAVESQRMLFPEVLNMGAEDLCIISELTDELTQVGIDVSIDSDAGQLSISSIPAMLDVKSVRALIETLAYDCRAGEADIRSNVVDLMVRRLATNGAMPYGRTLSTEEMTHLYERLMASDAKMTTPDGRPTMRTLTDREIEMLLS